MSYIRLPEIFSYVRDSPYIYKTEPIEKNLIPAQLICVGHLPMFLFQLSQKCCLEGTVICILLLEEKLSNTNPSFCQVRLSETPLLSVHQRKTVFNTNKIEHFN